MSKRRSPSLTPKSKRRTGAQASNFLIPDESESEIVIGLHLSDESVTENLNPTKAVHFNDVSDFIPVTSHSKKKSCLIFSLLDNCHCKYVLNITLNKKLLKI